MCLALCVTVVVLCRAGAAEADVEKCLLAAGGLGLGAGLPRTQQAIRARKTLVVVALGSSSTSGFGGFGTAYPEVLAQEMRQSDPELDLKIVNSGRLFDTLGGSADRLEKDVLRHRPDLVIWQVGTNDVLWRGIDDDAETLLRKSLRSLRATGADVILMDLQYAPMIRAMSAHARMQALIQRAARAEGVAIFPRFRLMQLAEANGANGLTSLDGLHHSADGYRCVGLALARMIRAAVAH